MFKKVVWSLQLILLLEIDIIKKASDERYLLVCASPQLHPRVSCATLGPLGLMQTKELHFSSIFVMDNMDILHIVFLPSNLFSDFRFQLQIQTEGTNVG